MVLWTTELEPESLTTGTWRRVKMERLHNTVCCYSRSPSWFGDYSGIVDYGDYPTSSQQDKKINPKTGAGTAQAKPAQTGR